VRGARVAGVVAAIALAFASNAHAAAINVTTTGDPGPAGTTSLRQAIAAAADGGTVSVRSGHYTLALGQITVAKAISIVGAGAATTIIDANHSSRVFNVTSAGTVTISGVTITNGTVAIGSTSAAGGGGVLASGAGTLTLAGDVLSGNTVTGGGGGASNQGGGGAYDNGGGMTISGSQVTGNGVTLNGSSGNNGGGAIYNNGSAVTIAGSALQNNFVTLGPTGTTSNDGGGAVFDNGGGMTISRSQLTGNSASVSGGTTNNGGGAYYENGSGLTLSSSSVTGNRLSLVGGTTNDGGGGIYNNGGPLGITTSTVASNTATLTGTAGFNGGGGIYNNGSTATLVNVTLSDNVLSEPSGLDVGGGGYYNNSSGGTFTNTTVAANQSNQPGGGILSGVSLSVKNTIVAGNRASSGKANCDGPMTNSSAGNNLEDTTPTTCGFTHASDLAGVPAGLGPLANNGGPGPTHALLAGSQAIDHIPAAQCTDQQGTPHPVTTDERGVGRSLDGFCDIGAYEFAGADVGISAGATPTSIVVSQHSTATFTIANSGPAPATATSVTVTIPTGLKLLSATPSQGSCKGTMCSLGVVNAGATAHVSLVVSGTRKGSQTIAAGVSATEPDPTRPDNAAAVKITVSPPSLTKLKVKPKAFKHHARVSYQLNVGARVHFTLESCRRSKHKGHRVKCKKRFGFDVNGTAGSNHFTIKPHLHKHKLAHGSYKLVATPEVGSTKGSSATVSFRIV
jgi:uncharacterized repeat protein (TIGR01451 family)